MKSQEGSVTPGEVVMGTVNIAAAWSPVLESSPDSPLPGINSLFAEPWEKPRVPGVGGWGPL